MYSQHRNISASQCAFNINSNMEGVLLVVVLGGKSLTLNTTCHASWDRFHQPERDWAQGFPMCCGGVPR